MPKVAVLISGEYRKLDVTRKTMPFLDSPDVDVYVSTWDKTVYSNKRMKIHTVEDITVERINKDLKRDATIVIDRHDLIPGSMRYNSNMVYKWLAGMKMIKQSNKQYDYVVVMRPDLFFNVPITLDYLEKYANTVGFTWATSMDLGKLPDVVFVSSYENMKRLLNASIFSSWNNGKETDWHKWWYTFVTDIFPEVHDVTEMSAFTFCRYWAKDHHSFVNVLDIQYDWRDVRLLDDVDRWGIGHAYRTWPEHVYKNALEKWNSGYFEKYKSNHI